MRDHQHLFSGGRCGAGADKIIDEVWQLKNPASPAPKPQAK
jgi:hypothetical protein